MAARLGSGRAGPVGGGELELGEVAATRAGMEARKRWRRAGRVGPVRPDLFFLLGLGATPRAAVGIAEAVGVDFFLFFLFPPFLLLSLNLFNLLNSLIFFVDHLVI